MFAVPAEVCTKAMPEFAGDNCLIEQRQAAPQDSSAETENQTYSTNMPDWRGVAFELLGETDERLRHSLDLLRVRIAENGRNDIRYEQGDEFLARFLRASKYEIDRAFRMLNGYYTNRQTIPQAIGPRGRGPKDAAACIPINALTVLDRKNWDGSTVFMYRKGDWEPTKTDVRLADMLFLGYFMVELVMRDPLVQLQGITVVFDAQSFGFPDLPYCDMSVFKFLLSAANGQYPVRVRAIHVLSCPSVFRFVLNLFKTFLSPKLRERLYVHSSREKLIKYVDPAILPEEYSPQSKNGPFSSEAVFRNLVAYHDWFVARSYYGLQPNCSE